jgi:hypothetical protein
MKKRQTPRKTRSKTHKVKVKEVIKIKPKLVFTTLGGAYPICVQHYEGDKVTI